MYKDYFNSLGYKYIEIHHTLIVKDFQRHCGIDSDGIIGPITRAKIEYFNVNNFCPEVFEHIKNGERYTSKEIRPLLKFNLLGLEKDFVVSAEYFRINVLHILAHAILESDWGRSAIAKKKNNLFGFAAYDSSPMASAKKFSCFEECIVKWCEFMNKFYLTEGAKYFHGDHENGINTHYASSPVAGINKSFIVRDLRNKLQ